MPLYEYRCEACGTQFTSLQPMAAPRIGIECPKCKGKETRRIVSTFATKASSPGVSGAPGGGPTCAPGGT